MSSEEKEIHPTPEEIAAYQRWVERKERRKKEPYYRLQEILGEIQETYEDLGKLVMQFEEEVDYLVSEEEARREEAQEEEGED